ncbi:MAG: endopeptidase La [Anaerolineae bacterium]
MSGDRLGTIANAEPDDNGFFIRPVLPLRDVVIYPKVIVPLSIPSGRAWNAAQYAQEHNQTVIGLTIRNLDADDDPDMEDLYSTGTELALGNILPMPEEFYSTLAEGRRRVEVVEVVETDPVILVKVRVLDSTNQQAEQIPLLTQMLLEMLQQSADFQDNLPQDVVNYAAGMNDPNRLADFVASTLNASLEDRQGILEMLDLEARMRFVATLFSREISMFELREEINDQIQEEMARGQREFYLREQMRIIQGELGEDDIFQQELDEVQAQILQARLPQEIYDKAVKELSRLKLIPPTAPEVGMIRTYLDWLVSLPWLDASADNLDVKQAQQVLDEDHYGLPKVKDRILEHIAVRKLAAEKMKSPILCFVGPPGVGKTSLGKSIAKALGREFVRVSLGGVRDEAEIRGHRRTYIGAMPGRIIQTMRRAGTVNPVFMLDEIDKLGTDFRGDPAAALLEALDPEQNREFSDHYLDTDYDLSRVMFITTANDLYPLPEALLDRMEVIEFPGYTEEDKLEIARHYLIPSQLESHGLDDATIRFDDNAVLKLIREYTYEAGVRNLNREIGTVCRKLARLRAEDKRYPKRITEKQIANYLGPAQYLQLRANDEDSIGIATGLAWTSGGGDTLTIEVSLLPGKGTLTLTGQLGEVMQESAQTALSYMRSVARQLDVPHDDFENYDVHIHLPEGAVPKDGPSAGITLAAAIISTFTERKIRSDIAMSGEVTLRGRVLPVGGIREKVLAAHRARIKTVLLPEQNRKDLVEVPAKALKDMNIVFVENMQQVMEAVLLEPPADGRERDRYKDTETEEDAGDDAT